MFFLKSEYQLIIWGIFDLYFFIYFCSLWLFWDIWIFRGFFLDKKQWMGSAFSIFKGLSLSSFGGGGGGGGESKITFIFKTKMWLFLPVKKKILLVFEKGHFLFSNKTLFLKL